MTKKKKTNMKPPKPRNTSGLKPWPKGVSGNPAGRPKYVTLSEAYRHRLEEPVPNDGKGRTWGELIADRIIAAALKGRVAAAAEIADRTEGRAPNFVQVSSPSVGSAPIFHVNFIAATVPHAPLLITDQTVLNNGHKEVQSNDEQK